MSFPSTSSGPRLRRIWYGLLGLVVGPLSDLPGVHLDVPGAIHRDLHQVQGAGRRASNSDPMPVVNGTMTWAVKRLFSRVPGDRAAQVHAFPVEGQQAILVVDQIELSLAIDVWISTGRGNLVLGDCDGGAELAGLQRPHQEPECPGDF